jgi:hypothetical protein
LLPDRPRKWALIASVKKMNAKASYLKNLVTTTKKMGGIDFHLSRPLGNNFCYGVSLLIRVFQSASAVRVPAPWLAPPHVPSRLSPLPPAKNGPPQSV